MSGSMSFVPPPPTTTTGNNPASISAQDDGPHEGQTLLSSPRSPELDGSPTLVPLGSEDITGLGGSHFPNYGLSRYSQASSLNSELFTAGGRSGSAMGLSTRSASGLLDDGDSATGLYAAPIPFGNRASTASPLGPNNSSSGAEEYALTAPDSPSLEASKEGFDLTSAEKYERGARVSYAADRDRATGGRGGGAGGGGLGGLWRRRKWWIVGGGLLALAVIVGIAVGVPVALSSDSSSTPAVPLTPAESSERATRTSTSGAAASSSASAKPVLAKFGVAGSNVILADGTEGFAYANDFGGYWGWDADRPFDTNAAGRAQSWSPALNETFTYGVDRIRGVNLGGWLNTEPFIVPGLYEKYYNATPRAVDEYTLCQAMGANKAAELEEHYKTFITEQDFMEIAAAGFNFVRIPIGFWAVETEPGEPYLEGVSWTYFLKAIEWARKYGLRINLDLHAVPGSQNGWNHSGRLFSAPLEGASFLYGQMGIANAQRTLNVIRTLTQFIMQDQYKDVIPMFGILNEPFSPILGRGPIFAFYTEVYDMIRGITGVGEGKGPWIVFHDAMMGMGAWNGFLENSDRVSLDNHPYFAFDTPPHTEALSAFPAMACNNWGGQFNTSFREFGLTQGGEFSFAINDCGLWVTNVDEGTRYEGTYPGFTRSYGSCDQWTDATDWDADRKEGFKNFIMAGMDATTNYFFWTWKIGASTQFSHPVNPMWNYQQGLKDGYAPTDPREADGYCASIGIRNSNWDGTLDSWMTGGAGAGVGVVTTAPWPPASMSSVNAAQMTQIPQLTQTGTPVTLAGPTYTQSDGTATYDAGSGWANAQDTARAFVKVAGCSYPDTWTANTVAPAATACGAGSIPNHVVKRAEPTAQPSALSRRFSREH